MNGKQTFKDTMERWADALKLHNAGQFEKCLDEYWRISEKSGRLYYNMGCAHIKLSQTGEALQCFSQSVSKDPHLAISFFQRGVLHLHQTSFDLAMTDFLTANTLLRGNTFINYKQLGLLCKLHLCEVLYNMMLVHIMKGEEDVARRLLDQCQQDTEYKHRKHISAAYTYFQGKSADRDLLVPMKISAESTFFPPKDVIQNLNKKNLMGKAKVVSASDVTDSDPTFNGPKRVEEIKMEKLKTPETPLLKVKKFLKNAGAKRDRSKSQGILMDTKSMKGSQSMIDLRMRSQSETVFPDWLANRFISAQKRNSSVLTLDVRKASSATNSKRNSPVRSPRDRKRSMGSIFGNTLSPLNTALSQSFDVLSALVVPVNDSALGRGFSPIGLDHEHFSSSSSESLNQNDDVSDVFLNSYPGRESLLEQTEKEAFENKTEEVKFTIDDNAVSKQLTIKIDTAEEGVESEGDIKRESSHSDNRGFLNESPRRRAIPPPPSYPPPPLPTYVLAHL